VRAWRLNSLQGYGGAHPTAKRAAAQALAAQPYASIVANGAMAECASLFRPSDFVKYSQRASDNRAALI
jgi:hypothetical protein